MDIILKSLLSFVALLLVARIMGHKHLGQLTFFDYIAGITMGNMAASVAIDDSVPVTTGLTGLAVWTIAVLILTKLDLKFPKFRFLVDGQPIIVIKKGNILKGALNKAGLDIDDLTMLLRVKDTFSIKEVEYAILEPNGELSILKRQSYQQPTKQDLGISVKSIKYIPTEVIADGEIIYKALKELGISEEWIYGELDKQNVKLETVLFGQIQEDGCTLVIKV